MASGPITSWQIDGETVADFIFLGGGSKITADGDCTHEIKRCLLLGKKSYDQPRQHIKKQRYYFANKGPSSQSYGFPSSPVWMWELNHKDSWALKNWCFWTVVLEKTLESPLDFRRSNQSILKEILNEWLNIQLKSWILIETLNIHWKDWCWTWSSNTLATWCKEQLFWKDPDAREDWGREEKGATEDEMVG